MIVIINVIFNFTNLCIVTSGILFPAVVNAELVAKPLILGILPSVSVTLALKSVSLTKPLTSGIFLSILLILSQKSDPSFSYLVFKTKFVVSILSTFVSKLLYSVFSSTLFFTTLLNLARPTETVFNLSASILLTSDFKLARFVFDAKLLTFACVTYFKDLLYQSSY